MREDARENLWQAGLEHVPGLNRTYESEHHCKHGHDAQVAPQIRCGKERGALGLGSPRPTPAPASAESLSPLS